MYKKKHFHSHLRHKLYYRIMCYGITQPADGRSPIGIIHGKSKKTHAVIFLWLSWLAVLLVSAHARRDDDDDDGVAQHGGHNRNEAKFIFVSFLLVGPIDSGADEISSKNEREREESRARINRDRSSQEDGERERAWLKERKRKWY